MLMGYSTTKKFLVILRPNRLERNHPYALPQTPH